MKDRAGVRIILVMLCCVAGALIGGEGDFNEPARPTADRHRKDVDGTFPQAPTDDPDLIIVQNENVRGSDKGTWTPPSSANVKVEWVDEDADSGRVKAKVLNRPGANLIYYVEVKPTGNAGGPDDEKVGPSVLWADVMGKRG